MIGECSSARQRVSDVELDDGLTPASGGAERTFTDYVGNAPVVDYYEPDDDPDELFAYLPGVAEIDLGTTPRTVSYLHTDLLGSTWFKTDTGGTVTSSLVSVRTAFGEIVTLDSGVASRYGYVGAHGYEEHDYDSGDGGTTYRGDGVPDNLLGRSATDGFPFMHVGARYYDPSTGRFLQRDPIGIRGGLNVYEYCRSNPTSNIDPEGKWLAVVWLAVKTVAIGAAAVGVVVGAVKAYLGLRSLAELAKQPQWDPGREYDIMAALRCANPNTHKMEYIGQGVEGVSNLPFMSNTGNGSTSVPEAIGGLQGSTKTLVDELTEPKETY